MVPSPELSIYFSLLVYALRTVGVLACAVLVVCYAPSVFGGFRLPVSSFTIRLFRLLSSKIPMFVLFSCFAYLLLSVLGKPPLDVEPLIACLLFGLFVSTWQGQQGIPIPLGQGLTLTIDKAPDLGFALTEYVISFHAKSNLLKQRRNLSKVVAENLVKISCLDHRYDVVFKSWIFGTFKSKDNNVMKLRGALTSVRRWIRVFFCGTGVAVIVWMCAGYTEYSNCMLQVGVFVIVATWVTSVAGLIRAYFLSFRLCSTVNTCPPPGFQSPIAQRLLQGLNAATQGFDTHFIDVRPLAKRFLMALSVSSRASLKSCDGNDGGFVLVRKSVLLPRQAITQSPSNPQNPVKESRPSLLRRCCNAVERLREKAADWCNSRNLKLALTSLLALVLLIAPLIIGCQLSQFAWGMGFSAAQLLAMKLFFDCGKYAARGAAKEVEQA